jgi:hypothetical protein
VLDDNDVTIAGHPSAICLALVRQTLVGYGLTVLGAGEDLDDLYRRLGAAVMTA